MKYYYDRGDYDGMRVKGESINWAEVQGMDTINDQWTFLKEKLKSLEDEFIPHMLVGTCKRHKGGNTTR